MDVNCLMNRRATNRELKHIHVCLRVDLSCLQEANREENRRNAA